MLSLSDDRCSRHIPWQSLLARSRPIIGHGIVPGVMRLPGSRPGTRSRWRLLHGAGALPTYDATHRPPSTARWRSPARPKPPAADSATRSAAADPPSRPAAAPAPVPPDHRTRPPDADQCARSRVPARTGNTAAARRACRGAPSRSPQHPLPRHRTARRNCSAVSRSREPRPGRQDRLLRTQQSRLPPQSPASDCAYAHHLPWPGQCRSGRPVSPSARSRTAVPSPSGKAP
jgi:hypothetical protein